MQEPKPASSGEAGGKNWIAMIVAAIVVAALNGQFRQPANKAGNARPKQVNIQSAAASERFWNEQIVRLALLEQTFPEPSADQTFGDFIRTAEEFLRVGIEQAPTADGSNVVVDAVNLFNRHRNDLTGLRAAVVAGRMKSTNADLNRPALDVIAATNAALAENALPVNDPAVSTLLALVERLEKHEVERAVLQGKLSERFPACTFKLPE